MVMTPPVNSSAAAAPALPAESPDRRMRVGIGIMVLAMLVFASQDALSRHLVEVSNASTVVWIRYWFFVIFVLVLAARSEGGLRAVARTNHPWIHVLRGLLLIVQLAIFINAFVLIGLVESHALYAVSPLVIVALSALVLREKVPPVAWLAVVTAALGVLVILQPGRGVFSPYALLVLLGATLFAAYSLLTRYVATRDTPMTNFFYIGIVGFVLMSLVGPFFWAPVPRGEWGWMALLCVFGAASHWLLIRAYEYSPASRLQPFAYLQLAFASAYGVLIFGETLKLTTMIGTAMIVGAGLVAWLHARKA
jgi:drug/metabolite transporter (DMT)-like permease